jgi:flavin-dependent dehydrogenase
VATHVAESIVVDLPVGVAYGRWLEDLESAGVWINDQTRDNEIAWTDTGDDRRTGVVLFEVLRRDSTSVELRLSVDRDGADEELRQQALADLELFRERAAT